VSILSGIGDSGRSIDLRSALLVLAIAVFYFLYQLTFLYFVTLTGKQGICMYSFWIPSQHWWQNPYWLVVAIVFGFLILSLFLLVEGIASKSRTKMVTAILAAAILTIWLYGLNGFWNAMLFEKGEISTEDWKQMVGDNPKSPLVEEEYVCMPST
jgi:hypothetical protein